MNVVAALSERYQDALPGEERLSKFLIMNLCINQSSQNDHAIV